MEHVNVEGAFVSGSRRPRPTLLSYANFATSPRKPSPQRPHTMPVMCPHPGYCYGLKGFWVYCYQGVAAISVIHAVRHATSRRVPTKATKCPPLTKASQFFQDQVLLCWTTRQLLFGKQLQLKVEKRLFLIKCGCIGQMPLAGSGHKVHVLRRAWH